MKVRIGPFLKYWGPYQIADLLCFWVPLQKDELGILEKPDWVHAFGEKLADSRLGDWCNWIHERRERKIKIRIDPYDIWSMDHTLSIIILPLLKQLKERKVGAPFVNDEDVPEELRSTNTSALKNKWDTDDNFFKRWEWILDEMIWAFEQNTIDWEDQFWEKYPELDDKKYPEDEGKKSKPVRWIEEGKHDEKGIRAHQERMANGFLLFGKYFHSLWT